MNNTIPAVCGFPIQGPAEGTKNVTFSSRNPKFCPCDLEEVKQTRSQEKDVILCGAPTEGLQKVFPLSWTYEPSTEVSNPGTEKKKWALDAMSWFFMAYTYSNGF